jgi:hypothetical protein
MKRILLSIVIVAGLLVAITPNARAEMLTFPCGPQGETYSVRLPEGIARANDDCVGSIVLDNRVKKIDYAGFSGLRLKSVTIPDSVVEIGDKAFWNIGLETVTLGRSVEKIGSQAFMNTKIVSINFPESLTEIGDSAFASSYLGWRNEIILPNSLKIIGDKVFWGSRLESISLPDNLQKLGKDVFVATNLTKITYCGRLTGFNITNERPIQFVEPICPPDRKVLIDAAAKAAAELKAKQDAEAKAAAELKAKQEAEAKAAAELKAKQEAEAKAAAELKAKQEAEAKAAAELKAKQEAEAKAAAEKTLCDANRNQLLSVQNSLLIAIKSYPKSSTSLSDTAIRLSNALSSVCISTVTLSDFKAEVAVAISQAKVMEVKKTTTITCIKGKLTKKVTAVNPKCPAGYKKK